MNRGIRMMSHIGCRSIHIIVIEHLLLHHTVYGPHNSSHVSVTVTLNLFLWHRIDAQQVETHTVWNNHITVHELTLLLAIVVFVEGIVNTQIFVKAYAQ